MSGLPNDPTVAVAVLYERLGHVMEKVDALSAKIDKQSAHRDSVMEDMDDRITKIEQQMLKARGFVFGLAAAGGALGGGLAAAFTKAFGG